MVEFKQMLPSILETGYSFTSNNAKFYGMLFEVINFFNYRSGGPLLDSKGNLIGINTAIFSQTGNFCIHICQKSKMNKA